MSTSPINMDNMIERFGNDRIFLRELFEIFMKSLREQRRLLEKAVGDGDAAEAREAVHLIAGASANVGAEAVSAVASELESLFIANAMFRATELLPRLDEECAKAVVFIQDYIDTPR
jgi:HPt (histidine-containing phosphotransfer) domain-containing protein